MFSGPLGSEGMVVCAYLLTLNVVEALPEL
jgi:hypothetical protein